MIMSDHCSVRSDQSRTLRTFSRSSAGIWSVTVRRYSRFASAISWSRVIQEPRMVSSILFISTLADYLGRRNGVFEPITTDGRRGATYSSGLNLVKVLVNESPDSLSLQILCCHLRFVRQATVEKYKVCTEVRNQFLFLAARIA